MAESAFIVSVPEAEACVGPMRDRYDASARLGAPAHVTIFVPFMPAERITPAVLAQVQAALNQVRSLTFSLETVGRFAATAYLAPEPDQPFITLTRALVRRFPEFPPFRGEHEPVVPHLTVANGNASEAAAAAAELATLIHTHGPIRGFCSSVSLIENSTGRWKQIHVFALPGRDS
jgi:2'-5' RNA ligase